MAQCLRKYYEITTYTYWDIVLCDEILEKKLENVLLEKNLKIIFSTFLSSEAVKVTPY